LLQRLEVNFADKYEGVDENGKDGWEVERKKRNCFSFHVSSRFALKRGRVAGSIVRAFGVLGAPKE